MLTIFVLIISLFLIKLPLPYSAKTRSVAVLFFLHFHNQWLLLLTIIEHLCYHLFPLNSWPLLIIVDSGKYLVRILICSFTIINFGYEVIDHLFLYYSHFLPFICFMNWLIVVLSSQLYFKNKFCSVLNLIHELYSFKLIYLSKLCIFNGVIHNFCSVKHMIG